MPDPDQKRPPRGRGKIRKWFKMQSSHWGGLLGLELENEDRLRGNYVIFTPSRLAPGSLPLPEPPRFRHIKKEGRLPKDLDEYSGFWLVSERMKAVLEEIDREAFLFIRCNLLLADGAPGPDLWLCDVVRVVDALDELASEIRISYEGDRKNYSILGGARLVFNENLIGGARIFRMEYSTMIICDGNLKSACKKADLKNIMFRDVEKL